MGKFEKKKKKKIHKYLISAVVLILLAMIFALFVMPRILYEMDGGNAAVDAALADSANEGSLTTEANQWEEQDAGSEATVPALLEFPVALDDGKLQIESIFQFDGINPDSNNQEGKNIATATVMNLSDTYLESAELSVTTDSGEILRFVVTDLPAGKTALVFSADNASVDKSAAYTDAVCKSVFSTEASMHEDKVAVTVEGTKVTLKNNTSEEIANAVVYCHASLGDQFFGGITYNYTVNNLPAYGTAEIDAAECFLGLTEVVRVAINES